MASSYSMESVLLMDFSILSKANTLVFSIVTIFYIIR